MRVTGYARDRLNLGTKDGRGAVILAEVGERELSDKTITVSFARLRYETDLLVVI